jgi:hypothetical protein
MYYDAYFGIYPRSELHQISSTDITAPLGQLAIATGVRRVCPEATVKVFYGEVTDEKIIRAEIERMSSECRRVLVGLTLNAGSTGNALRLARYFDSLGMDVILGGPEVWLSYLDHGDLIIRDKPYVRAVGVGAGEHIVAKVVRQGWSAEIPNLVFRKKRHGELEKGEINPSELDFGGIEIDYSLQYGIEEFHGVSYLWKTDCHLARGQRCYFCGRVELGFGTRTPERVWEELRQARDLWGIRRFYNAADSVAVSLGSLQRFVDAQPSDFGDEMHRCFINAHQVNARTIEYLKRLNALAAIGVESYALFDTVGKRRSTVEINERAITLLNNVGIPLVLSFVLGLPGETEETLLQTTSYIESLVDRFPMITSVEMSPLTITAGTSAYRDLMTRVGDEFGGRFPPYDLIELSNRYFEVCCAISRKQTIEIAAVLARKLKRTRRDMWVDVKGMLPQEREEAFPDLKVGNESLPYSWAEKENQNAFLHSPNY